MEMTDLLSRIIRSNSISSINPAIDQGNREVIDLLANTLGELGFTTEIMDLGNNKANLIATYAAVQVAWCWLAIRIRFPVTNRSGIAVPLN